MKIRAKLFTSFIIIVAIGVFLGIIVNYSNRKLTASSEDMLYLSETRSNVSSILSSHYIWRHSLSEAVYANAAFTGSLDSEVCFLGKWLGSDEAKKITDTEIVSLLRQIAEPHNFIHTEAEVIINDLNNRDTDDAVKHFREQVLPKTQEVISYLEQMNDRYGVLLWNKTHEIYELGVIFKIAIAAFLIVLLVASVLLSLIISSYHNQSTVDELTGLKNRRDFMQTFKRRITNYRSSDDWLCIAIMDIDYFKNYNDHYGHPKGDECLRSIGKLLNTLNDRGVYAARIGGEEFALIWHEKDAMYIDKTVSQIQQMINELNIPHEKSITAPHITVSVGIHTLRCGTSNDIRSLYDYADKALYDAKRSGRNRAVIYGMQQ